MAARVAAVLVAPVVGLAACGGSGPPRSSATSPPTSAGIPTSAATHHQTITVTPDTGLANHQHVTVTATGFRAGESDLVVTECANKGTATGEGDCDLTAVVSATADGRGDVNVQFSVATGPFGSNHIVCSTTQACEISVSQATINPTEEADTNISFAS